jgi:hypothetical protein
MLDTVTGTISYVENYFSQRMPFSLIAFSQTGIL